MNVALEECVDEGQDRCLLAHHDENGQNKENEHDGGEPPCFAFPEEEPEILDQLDKPHGRTIADFGSALSSLVSRAEPPHEAPPRVDQATPDQTGRVMLSCSGSSATTQTARGASVYFSSIQSTARGDRGKTVVLVSPFSHVRPRDGSCVHEPLGLPSHLCFTRSPR